VKRAALVRLPKGVVTVIGPLFALAGTLTENFVFEAANVWVAFALTPPNLTEAATNPLPVIVTSVPGFPLAGLKPEITGRPIAAG